LGLSSSTPGTTTEYKLTTFGGFDKRFYAAHGVDVLPAAGPE
jgi:hypothetical protein